ncbi:hypothetical protein A2U01_0089140, partial [Trifolium medium]|nr:hypothetical protein [Trifolium medium]
LELAEFEILYESRKALKAQVLTDFVAEMTTPTTPEKKTSGPSSSTDPRTPKVAEWESSSKVVKESLSKFPSD